MPTVKRKNGNKDQTARAASRARRENVTRVAPPKKETTPMSDSLSDYISVSDAAVQLGVTHDHVNHLLTADKLRGKRMGRFWLVYVPSLEHYIKTKPPKIGRPPSRKPQAQTENE